MLVKSPPHIRTELVRRTQAFDGSSVLDIKPYTPSLDRVEHPNVLIGAVIGRNVMSSPASLNRKMK
jgi:hypothetical protein